MKSPRVPFLITLALCSVMFFIGRYVQESRDLPPAVAPQLDVESGKHLRRRDLRELSAHEQQHSINPLDPVELEHFMVKSSGLSKVRGPLPAAESGDSFIHAIPRQILSWSPRIVVFPSFIDKARCEHIIRMANSTMFKSAVAFRPGEQGDFQQEIRTSAGSYLMASSDDAGVLSWLEERVAAVSLLPVSNGEAWNVLRYENMQHYDSHYDTFDPKDFGPQSNQRIVTVLVYLSEVEEGGETVFKREGYNGADRSIQDWRNCDDGIGFKYKPRMGDAVMFWTVQPDLQIDQHALHGGCPVKKGTKWVATKWIHDKGINYGV